MLPLFFSKYSFFTFVSSGIPIMYITCARWYPTIFESLLHSLHCFFFLFLIINHLNRPVFILMIISSASSYLLLSLFSEFFISGIILFNSRISIWFFFIICLFIVTWCLVRYFFLWLSFNSSEFVLILWISLK